MFVWASFSICLIRTVNLPGLHTSTSWSRAVGEIIMSHRCSLPVVTHFNATRDITRCVRDRATGIHDEATRNDEIEEILKEINFNDSERKDYAPRGSICGV
ncbi:hypothetical protein BDV59DRAFT_181890 [Aspergillus ambiguus]|uniref:uncharacterized protein n=1 Tax=Aspergillus ambiguus TaxID=176160 RepID=UPI003CCD43F3